MITLLTDLTQVPPNITANIITAILFKFGSSFARPLVECVREHFRPTSAADQRRRLLDDVQAGNAGAQGKEDLARDIALLIKQDEKFRADVGTILSKILAEHAEAAQEVQSVLTHIVMQMEAHDKTTQANHQEVIGFLKELLSKLQPAHPTPSSPHDPFPIPPHLYGREADYKRLHGYLTQRKPPVIQLIGQSGVGKTRLAAAVVRDLKLDYVRVELHNESADTVTNRLFEIFYEQPAPLKPHAELVALIVDAWHKRNCLLVIDNLHCLLNADSTPKDDAAKLFLQKLGETEDQLLTLGWPGTEALGTSNERVVKWKLEGIKEQPGVEKLREEKVKGTPKTITLEQVVDNLDGNPKMLEILAELIRKHGGQATILDEYPTWVESSMAPLRAVWEAIGSELQELVAALCVFRRGRNAERLSRFLHPPVHGGTKGGRIQAQLESLISWGLARSIDGIHDYTPDHDLVRRMVREHFGEEKLLELHRRAADLWLEEGKDIGKEKTPTTIEEIQPLLEAGYHMAQRKDGDAILWLMWTRRGDFDLDDLAGMFGAWMDRTELWKAAAQYAGDKSKKAKARHNLGIAYQQRGDWDAALQEYRASLEIAEQLGDRAGVSRSRHQIGRVFQLKGDWDAALVEYRASLKILEQLGDRMGVASSRQQIGIVYQDKGDWDAALAEYRASLEIKEQLGDQAGIASSVSQIAIVEHLKGNWDEALSGQRKSLDICQNIGDLPGQSICHHAIGRVYQDKGDWDAALVEYRASLEIQEQLADRVRIAYSLGQIGQVFRLQKRFADAFDHSLKAFSMFLELGAKHQIGIVLRHLVALRRDWGVENFDRAWKEKMGEEVPEEIMKYEV